MKFLTYQLVIAVVIKNCEPLVFLPALAMDSRPEEKTQRYDVGIGIVDRCIYIYIHIEKQNRQEWKGS